MGQLIVGISGYTLSQEEKEVLSHPLIEGVILFTRNYENLNQLQALTTSIHAIHTQPHPRLSIYVDQEGGSVQRFREGFTSLPSPGELTQENAEHYGKIMASELKARGLDFSFAPVLDLNKQSIVIGKRAFSATPQEVIAKAAYYIQGMKSAEMPAIVKHFPGHGTALADTHFSLAIDERPFSEIEAEDLLPFEYFIQKKGVGVMMAHVVYPQIDPLPASLSPYWIQTILRQKLQFKGKIYSDDLGMKALAGFGSPSDIVQATFSAGCDYALLCNDWHAVLDTLTHLEIAR